MMKRPVGVFLVLTLIFAMTLPWMRLAVFAEDKYSDVLETEIPEEEIDAETELEMIELETESVGEVVSRLIGNGLGYLSGKSMVKYGDGWTIFTWLRSGQSMTDVQRNQYLDAVKEKFDKGKGLALTDYARETIVLTQMGIDPTDFYGLDLTEKLYNAANMDRMMSNNINWALIALDCYGYSVPEGALHSREALIQRLLDFQCADGSFGLYDNQTGSLDMTAMILQSLAMYNDADHPEVQAAVQAALMYLVGEMTEDCGFIEGDGENSCTLAQVITALAALGLDPLDERYGFVRGEYNLLRNAEQFMGDSGFSLYPTGTVDLISTYQSTYGLLSYDRYMKGMSRLYDLSAQTLTKAQEVNPKENPEPETESESIEPSKESNHFTVNHKTQFFSKSAPQTINLDVTALEDAKISYDHLTSQSTSGPVLDAARGCVRIPANYVGVIHVEVKASETKSYLFSQMTTEIKILPEEVSGLKAKSAGRGKVTLTWNQAAGANGYMVYGRHGKDGAYEKLALTTGTTWTDTHATDAAYSFYWVYPYAKIQDGWVEVTTSKTYTYGRGLCLAVTNLKAASQTGAVKLTWDKATGAEGYLIYGIRGNQAYGYIGMTSLGNSFTDKKALKTDYNFYWVFPYHKDQDGKMIVGGTAKYVWGKAR